MVVGKTSKSISKEDILAHLKEADIVNAVFPEVTYLPYLMRSPLRKDSKPSFSLYMSNGGHVYYKDHALKERGSLFDLLGKYWNCSYDDVLKKIGRLMVGEDNVAIHPRKMKTLTRKETDLLTKIQVVVRPWRDYDIEYWKSYGVDKKWLRYAEVYPISHKIVTKKESLTDKGKDYIFSADKYAYVYVERKEGKLQIKIYQPYNTEGYKWCSKMDASVIGLWTKVPETGDRIIICSSLKDALCISCQLNIPAICLQGEGYGMSDTAINELKRRFKKVFISFDTDKAGVQDSTKLSEHTGFINVIPDLGKSKDYSDYYKSLEDKSQFQLLENLFH